MRALIISLSADDRKSLSSLINSCNSSITVPGCNLVTLKKSPSVIIAICEQNEEISQVRFHAHDIWLGCTDLIQVRNWKSAEIFLRLQVADEMPYKSMGQKGKRCKGQALCVLRVGAEGKKRGAKKKKRRICLEDANRILQCEWVEGTVTKWEFGIDPDTQRPCGTKDTGRNITCDKKGGN